LELYFIFCQLFQLHRCGEPSPAPPILHVVSIATHRPDPGSIPARRRRGSSGKGCGEGGRFVFVRKSRARRATSPREYNPTNGLPEVAFAASASAPPPPPRRRYGRNEATPNQPPPSLNADPRFPPAGRPSTPPPSSRR
jgi:hypothetical protein